MKKLFIFLLFICCSVLSYSNPKKISKDLTLTKNQCYEYQESVERWVKDKYPEYSRISIYQDENNIYYLVFTKKNKTGDVIILDSDIYNDIKFFTPISDKKIFNSDIININDKINVKNIKKSINSSITEKCNFYLNGYKKRYIDIYFNNHLYRIKYFKYIDKLF